MNLPKQELSLEKRTDKSPFFSAPRNVEATASLAGLHLNAIFEGLKIVGIFRKKRRGIQKSFRWEEFSAS